MKVLLQKIIFALSLLAMPGFAAFDASDCFNQVDYSYKEANFSVDEHTFGETTSRLPEELLGVDANDQQNALSDTKELSSENPPLIPLRVSAMVFRDNLQTRPIYWSKAEFNPPIIMSYLSADIHFKQNESPWFVRSKHQSGNRLSGWKDGNSLYSANITYY